MYQAINGLKERSTQIFYDDYDELFVIIRIPSYGHCRNSLNQCHYFCTIKVFQVKLYSIGKWVQKVVKYEELNFLLLPLL